jgi:Leucine-rich repeat (LRR) protein
LCDCLDLEQLLASHNRLERLPSHLFLHKRGSSPLRILALDHNLLTQMPRDIGDAFPVEELYLQKNRLSFLPMDLLSKAFRLRVFNATNNQLRGLPLLNPVPDLNKEQEVYLSGNRLGDDAVRILCGCLRLRVLHLAYNEIQHVTAE